MDVSTQELEFPSLKAPATGDPYENGNKTKLTAGSSLQDIVSAMLKDKTLDKPTVILFHTGHEGSPSGPYKSSQRALAMLKNTDPRKGGLNTGLALHFGFAVFTSEVGAPSGNKAFNFKWLNYKKAPLALVVDTDGKIVGKTGGNGSDITAARLGSLLSSSSKKMGVNLKSLLKKELELIDQITAKTKKIEALRAKLTNANQATADRFNKMIEKTESEKAALEQKEIELWAWPDPKKST